MERSLDCGSSEVPRDRRAERLQPALPEAAKSVRIAPLNHGFVVEVGCQSFAIESVDKVTTLLNAYLKHPVETETAWLKNNKNDEHYPKL